MYQLTRYRTFHTRRLIPVLLLAVVSKRRVFFAVSYSPASDRPLPGCKVPVPPSSLYKKGRIILQFNLSLIVFIRLQMIILTLKHRHLLSQSPARRHPWRRRPRISAKVQSACTRPRDSRLCPVICCRHVPRIDYQVRSCENETVAFHDFSFISTLKRKLIIVRFRISDRSSISGKRSDRERSWG